MFPEKRQTDAKVDPKTYPLGEKIDHSSNGHANALVALSHTPLERRLYSAMLAASQMPADTTASLPDDQAELFTVKRLVNLTGITSLSTVRRGLEGLAAKFSVEREPRHNGNGSKDHGAVYRVFTPEQVIARRGENGFNEYDGAASMAVSHRLERVVQRVVENRSLSRREAQVALCCAEGLTNAEIGSRLLVSEQTVKFHLRHIFIKFGVKRRAELISRLLI